MTVARAFPAEGQVWEVIAHGVAAIKSHAVHDRMLEVGTKFVINKQANDREWWEVLIWGEKAYLHSARIVTGCKLLNEP